MVEYSTWAWGEFTLLPHYPLMEGFQPFTYALVISLLFL